MERGRGVRSAGGDPEQPGRRQAASRLLIVRYEAIAAHATSVLSGAPASSPRHLDRTSPAELRAVPEHGPPHEKTKAPHSQDCSR